MRLPTSTAALGALVLGLLAPGAGGARGAGIEDFGGHLSIGYARLFADEAPGGSLSVAGGVDHRLVPGLRVGVGLGYHLLGSRTVIQGSQSANVDYSLFEVVLMAHWIPERLGPIGIVSAGPALMSARAELSTSEGGAGFSDKAVEEVAPGVTLDATLVPRNSAPVRVGFEVGCRVAFLESERWTLATARLSFHY